jgi:thiol:disulfide interchange protein
MELKTPRFWLPGLALLALATVAGAGAPTDWSQIDWFDDAGGYADAVAEADRSGKPVLVYFYTDWCPYCRQLNGSLLADTQVQAELGRMLAVRVNPESGPDERSLASHYRVRGYPALFVYTRESGGRFEPIRRTVGSSGNSRLKTADEFVATLKAAGQSGQPRAGSP